MVKTQFQSHVFSLQTLSPSDHDMMRDEWFPLLTQIFTDPNDNSPIEELLERLNDSERNTFTLLRNYKGEAVGLRLIMTDPEIPLAGYIPWGGVVEGLRNYGIYPKMVERTLEEMKGRGLVYSLHDFEDPARIRAAYPDEPDGVPELRATKRLNFFRRSLNAYIIDDKDIPYIRPSSEDNSEIQAYDLLSFSALDYAHPALDSIFNLDHTAISKDAYRRFYLEITKLQYGALPENELRQLFPAVDSFLSVLDKSPKQWVSLMSDPVKPKMSVNMEAFIA